MSKKTLPNCKVNESGVCKEVKEEPFYIDESRRYYLFNVVPMGAVRMSSSDRWKTNPNHPDPNKRQREEVTRYFAYKDQLRQKAKEMNYELGETLEIIFVLPMPESWSKKKKERMNRMTCKVKPDFDNLEKGFCDALKKQDSQIWKCSSEKRYSYAGFIIVYQ